jgi:hypothetical protein
MNENETLVILAVNVEPFQLALFKESLDENGIESFVTGGNNAYGGRGIMYVSKGIATYTIRVRKKDEQRAITIMAQLGYKAFSEDEEEQNFLKQLAAPTEKIPFLAQYSLNRRLVIMAVTITAVITIIILCFLKVY